MAVDRSELHHLVDELPDDQVASAADELPTARTHRPHAPKPLSWMAMGPSKHAGTDDARRVDEILAGDRPPRLR
ncbi:MAG: hypothetical protein ACRCXL_05165 [Dermatophilaceae bacterium]